MSRIVDVSQHIKIKIIDILSKHLDIGSMINQTVQISDHSEFTIVHLAAMTGQFKLVHYFIDKFNFNTDFYLPNAKLTLLHTIAKHYLIPMDVEDEKDFLLLVNKSNNLLLRNNFGKTSL